MPAPRYATTHPDLIVRTLESFRKQYRLTVAQFSWIAQLNPRTYEAYLAGVRAPAADRIRWITVRHVARGLIGVLRSLNTYTLPHVPGDRYYAVVVSANGRTADTGEGPDPLSAIGNAAWRVARMSPSVPVGDFTIAYEKSPW